MKIKITKSGIFGKDGAVPVGQEFDVKAVPARLAGHCVVLSGDSEAEGQAPKAAVTNPAKGKAASNGAKG